MTSRIFCVLAVACLCAANLSAQTIRFDTNVGTFDMKLNPTGNPFLQGHVDNMLDYVEAGRYDLTVINRAATGFVLQMGGFQSPFLSLPATFAAGSTTPIFDPSIGDVNNDRKIDFSDAFPAVRKFGSVIVDADNDKDVDFDLGDLTNNRGSVTLALAPNQPNSGTSSFFVNLNDTNDFLDAQGFVPFAVIENMETINLIVSLPQANLDPSGQDLGAINIPVLEDNKLVFIERAFVVDTPATMLQSLPSVIDPLPVVSDPPLDDPTGNLIVPEPSSLALAGAMATLSLLRRRRIA